MSTESQVTSERETRLHAVIAEYLQAHEAGAKPDPDALVRMHPELATELEAFFANQERFARLAEPVFRVSEQATLTHAGDVAAPSCTPPTQPSQVGPWSPAARIQYFGDYELLDEIGRGGMGVVYRARQVSLKRVVALKMILTGQLADDADVRRFQAEAEAAAKLDHPGIVTVFEVGKHEGHHYFSMAFVEGESLARQLAEGLPSPRHAAELLKKVAEAVSYAHVEGVIHRDLKPANILIDKVGQPRLTDFGLAKRVNRGADIPVCLGPADRNVCPTVHDLTATGQVLGTPSYMPPEQASGQKGQVGPASDVYSLGAVLYCMLTGRPPFQAATALDTLLQVLDQEPAPPRQLNSSVPRDLETICLKCLQKEPTKRYGSARELVADLDRFLTGQPIQARPTTRRERLVKWMRRRPAAAALVGVSGVAAASLLVLGIALLMNADRLAQEASKREAAERERANLVTKEADLLTAQVAAARNHVYSSDIYLAGLAFDNNDSQSVANYLDSQRPKAGEADLRGFEWRYLWRKNNSERLNLLKAGIVSAGPQEHSDRIETRRYGLTDPRLLVYSPDGKYLATTRDVCDAATGKVLIEYDDVKEPRLYFSHDSKILFAGWRLFDLTKNPSLTPQERGKGGFTIPRGPEERLVPLGFIGKQNAFVVVTSWHPARQWDSKKLVWIDLPMLKPMIKSIDIIGKETVHEIEEHKGMQIVTAALSAESGRLAVAWEVPNTGSTVLEVDVLDLVQGGRKAFKCEYQHNPHEATELRMSPDGALFAVFRPGDIGLYESATGKERARLDVRDIAARSLCFSADSKTLMLLGGDGTGVAKLRVWHATTGTEAGDWQGKNNNVGNAFDILAALSPDGKTIATVSSEKLFSPAAGIVKLWDTATGKLRTKFLGHRHQVFAVTFSPDGKSLATLDHYLNAQVPTNVNIKVWNVSDEHAPIGLPLDTSMVTAVDASPDGKTVAVAFGNGKIQICDAGSLKVLRTFGQDWGPKLRPIQLGTAQLDTLIFSPTGSHLAASLWGSEKKGNIDLWDLAADKVADSFPGYLSFVREGWGTRSHIRNSLSIGAFNGTMLAASSAIPKRDYTPKPNSMKLWELGNRKPLLDIKDVDMFALSNDGKWAATAIDPWRQKNQWGGPYQVKLWEVATGKERLLPGSFFSFLHHSLHFSPDGKYLALAGQFLDVTPEGVKRPDGGRDTGSGVRLYETATEKVTFLAGNHVAAFSPDSKLLVNIGAAKDNPGGKITLWDAATAKELATLSNPERLSCDYPVFAPDGKTFAVLTIAEWTRAPWRDGKVFTDGTEISMKQTDMRGYGRGGYPGKESYQSAHPVYEIHVWDVPSLGAPLPRGEGLGVRDLPRRNRFIVSWLGNVNAVVFGHDGRSIYTLSHQEDMSQKINRLQAWDIATGKERGGLGDHGAGFHGLAFAPDGRLLAMTEQRLNVRLPVEYADQQRVRLWEMTTLHPTREIAAPRMISETDVPVGPTPMSVDLSSMTVVPLGTVTSPDGKVHAQRTGAAEIRLVDAATNKTLHVLKGISGYTRLTFSPDGKTLAVGLNDGTIRLWNVAAGRHMLTIAAHAGPVTGLAFRADGRELASCNETEIRMWQATTNE